MIAYYRAEIYILHTVEDVYVDIRVYLAEVLYKLLHLLPLGLSYTVIRRDKDGKQTTYTIDLVEIGEKGRIEKDIVLRAGDVVWVPETWY